MYLSISFFFVGEQNAGLPVRKNWDWEVRAAALDMNLDVLSAVVWTRLYQDDIEFTAFSILAE